MESVVDVKPDALKSYLNDHQAGSIAGTELAEDLAERHENDEFFSKLSKEIAEDKATLERLMEKFEISGSSVKQAGAWVFEKLGSAAGDEGGDLSYLRKIETLMMGIKGKQCLWEALDAIADSDERLRGFDFKRLGAAAATQIDGLRERQGKAARKALLG